MIALFVATLALAGTLQVDTGGGATVRVDGKLARYDASGLVLVESAGGTHHVRVKPVFGRGVEAEVEVPAEGAVRLVLRDGSLERAAPLAVTATGPLTAGFAPASPPAPVPSTPSESAAADLPAIPDHAVPIYEGTRGFKIPIRLADGTVVEASFDTGATRLGLCPDLARAGGFVQTGTGRSITPGGTVVVQSGELPSIELLGHRMRRVSATVYPDAPCTLTMLGMEQLAHLEAVLRDGTLWVWIGAPHATEGSSDFTLDSYGTLVARVRLGSREVELTVDTGASHVNLSPAQARLAGALPTGEARRFETAATTQVNSIYTVPSLSLGGYEARDVPAVVVPGLAEGLLGRSALLRLDAEWRFSRGRASLHPRRADASP